MSKGKWYKQAEMIIALSALFVSLVTAAVAVYSAYIDRSYARASVWPRLEIYRSYTGEKFQYGITNSGNGPALINYAVVKYKDKPIKKWRDIPHFDHFAQSHFGNRILSPQNTIAPVIYKGEDARKYAESDALVSIEVCYCSIYDECWLTSRTNAPETVESCSVDPRISFSQ